MSYYIQSVPTHSLHRVPFIRSLLYFRDHGIYQHVLPNLILTTLGKFRMSLSITLLICKRGNESNCFMSVVSLNEATQADHAAEGQPRILIQ